MTDENNSGRKADTESLRKAAGTNPGDSLWVFGYGSLIWSPCFTYQQALAATVSGWHRSFCLYSHKYRGTEENPGLVLGLDHGGFCQGVVFEIAPRHTEEALLNLWEREMGVEDFYEAAALPVSVIGEDDMKINALAFVVDRKNSRYCPGLETEKTVDIISSAQGQSGTNAEYLEKTVMGLQRVGIQDQEMEDLLSKVRLKTFSHAKMRSV